MHGKIPSLPNTDGRTYITEMITYKPFIGEKKLCKYISDEIDKSMYTFINIFPMYIFHHLCRMFTQRSFETFSGIVIHSCGNLNVYVIVYTINYDDILSHITA